MKSPKNLLKTSNNAQQISVISDDFFNYDGSLKIEELLKEGQFEIDPETGKLPFEAMDKT